MNFIIIKINIKKKAGTISGFLSKSSECKLKRMLCKYSTATITHSNNLNKPFELGVIALFIDCAVLSSKTLSPTTSPARE